MIRVRELRDDQGLTLSDLEHQTGIDRQTIWRYENAKMVPSIERAYLLATALGVSLDDLYVHEPEASTASTAAAGDPPVPANTSAPTDAGERHAVGASAPGA